MSSEPKPRDASCAVTSVTLAKQAEKFAKAGVETARKLFEIKLDYSEESLERLEALLEIFHTSLQEPRLKKDVEQQLSGLSVMFGSYLGETIRRKWGGRWTVASDNSAICLVSGKLTMFPTAKIIKRVKNGRADSIVEFYKKFVETSESKK